jgi:WhiB family transcriptional regulator, redox-sensing transcriptional regulator
VSWGDWRDQAACIGEDPEIFFPPQYENATAAKRICARCTVRGDCLDYALEHNLQHGIWGGISINKRRARRRQRLEATT